MEPEVHKLSNKFLRKNEIFGIDDKRKYYLSYAADPNLFLWLKNRKIQSNLTPYVIESPSIYFRKIKSGSVNNIDKLKQFSFPDIHAICTKKNASEYVIELLDMYSQNMKSLFNTSWYLKLTVSDDFYNLHPNHINGISSFFNEQNIEVKITKLSEERYFSYKLGLFVSAGYSEIMIYNVQWDQTNSALFNISLLDTEEPPVIIHSTFAGAINRVYPAAIGQILKNEQSRYLPVNIAPYQVGIISANTTKLQKIVGVCSTHNIRCLVLENISFKSSQKKIKDRWIPYTVIIPEDQKQKYKIFNNATQTKIENLESLLQEILNQEIAADEKSLYNQLELPF